MRQRRGWRVWNLSESGALVSGPTVNGWRDEVEEAVCERCTPPAGPAGSCGLYFYDDPAALFMAFVTLHRLHLPVLGQVEALAPVHPDPAAPEAAARTSRLRILSLYVAPSWSSRTSALPLPYQRLGAALGLLGTDERRALSRRRDWHAGVVGDVPVLARSGGRAPTCA